MHQTEAIAAVEAAIAGRWWQPWVSIIAEPGPRGTVVIRHAIATSDFIEHDDEAAALGAAVYAAAHRLGGDRGWEYLAAVDAAVLDPAAVTADDLRQLAQVVGIADAPGAA